MAAMAESASLLESDLESAAPPETPPWRLRAIGAVLLGLASAAILAALLLEPQDDSHGHPHGLRLLQAVGGGSAIGSCWLKCGAAVGKAIHTAGAFIARLFVNMGRCIHSIFANVNEGFGHCCGAMGHQLDRCPGCGHWCSHCWNASGRCMGGCCISLGDFINGSLVVCGTSISGCCDVFSGFFHGMWSSCGNFLSETCPF